MTRPVGLLLGVSLWIATLGNAALWRELAGLSVLQGAHGAGFAVGLTLMIVGALCLLLSPWAWRWTFKPMLILTLLSAALETHFMLTYGIVLDVSMMTNVLQTDVREASEFINLRLLATLLLLGVLPAAAVWRWPLAYARWPRQLLHNALACLASCAVLLAALYTWYAPLSATSRNHTQLRFLVNPLNAWYALGYFATQPLRRAPSPLRSIALDAAPGPSYAAQTRPPLLLLVLGETARSGNFGLNGYARATTPELERLPVASLRNVWSCGTSTAASVPCMFSSLAREDYDSDDHAEGLLDAIRRAGLAVLWIDNQAGCKGVCDRVPSVSTTGQNDAALCPGGECLDAVMLEGLEQRIQNLPQRSRGVVIVMHQMGSHGPAYFKRSPPELKKFLPECTRTELQDCPVQEVVNAYDNSVLYTDHFLALSIRWLQSQQARYDTALVYVADHGESLGENHLYLHGLPYAIAPDVQKRVPWITWASDGYTRRTGVSAACLQPLRDVKLSHDHYFHSVLGLLDIRTAVYQRALDIYAACAAR